MKKLYPYGLMALLCLLATSCKDEQTPASSNKAEVVFSTEVQTRALPGVTTSLEADGTSLRLFVSASSSIRTDHLLFNSKLTRQSGNWKGTPAVEVEKGTPVYLFATYPCCAETEAPDTLPVEIESQTDYLYSGNGVAASFEQPAVLLTLKHALAMLSFNVKKEDYQGEGVLQKITIQGAAFHTQGHMSVTTGNITGNAPGSYTKNCNLLLQSDGWTEDMPAFFCIPFVSSGSNITLTCTVDGVDYSAPLPKQGISGGVKYQFHAALTSIGLTIFEGPEIVSLNNNTDNMTEQEYGILRITHENRTFQLPSFTGKNITGTIYWGDNQEETFGLQAGHTYNDAGPYTVTIETWGVEKVSLPDLKKVTEIDLSGM